MMRHWKITPNTLELRVNCLYLGLGLKSQLRHCDVTDLISEKQMIAIAMKCLTVWVYCGCGSMLYVL